MNTYRTMQGDTWDMIAFKVYGAGYESQAGEIMKNNPELLDFFVFPAGINVNIPELAEDMGDLPPWRI